MFQHALPHYWLQKVGWGLIIEVFIAGHKPILSVSVGRSFSLIRAFLTISFTKCSIEHSSGGLISLIYTVSAAVAPSHSTGWRLLAPSPVIIQSGLTPRFLHKVRSQSEGMLPLFFASAIDDCLIPKNSASSVYVLHPAASKNRSSGVDMRLLLVELLCPFSYQV